MQQNLTNIGILSQHYLVSQPRRQFELYKTIILSVLYERKIRPFT